MLPKSIIKKHAKKILSAAEKDIGLCNYIYKMKLKYIKNYKKTKENFYIRKLIKGSITLADIPNEFVTRNILDMALDISPSCISTIDKSLIDEKLIEIATRSKNFDAHNFPKKCGDIKLWKYLCAKDNLTLFPDNAEAMADVFGGIRYIPANILTEEFYLKLIDNIDSDDYILFNPYDELLTDKIIEKALTKFPTMIADLVKERMCIEGKKWYEFAVVADIQNKLKKEKDWRWDYYKNDTIFEFY